MTRPSASRNRNDETIRHRADENAIEVEYVTKYTINGLVFLVSRANEDDRVDHKMPLSTRW